MSHAMMKEAKKEIGPEITANSRVFFRAMRNSLSSKISSLKLVMPMMSGVSIIL